MLHSAEESAVNACGHEFVTLNTLTWLVQLLAHGTLNKEELQRFKRGREDSRNRDSGILLGN